MSDEADHSVAPLVYRVACVLARAAGRLDDGEPENWANYTHDATLVLEALYEPRRDMTVAIESTYGEISVGGFCESGAPYADFAAEIWKKMLRVGAWIEEEAPK